VPNSFAGKWTHDKQKQKKVRESALSETDYFNVVINDAGSGRLGHANAVIPCDLLEIGAGCEYGGKRSQDGAAFAKC
jgi:hypothetical protein